MILSELKDISVIDWGNTSLTKKSYQDLGKFLGVSAAGCDGRMDHAEHEVGTLVLSAIGAKCGKMFFPNESFTAIKNTITIKPNDSADSKYLYYYLNNNQIQSRGAGQPFITKGAVSKTKIPLPPLDQQKKIAAILDAADAYKQKTKALIAKYDELTQSLFIDMFGDPVTNPKGWRKHKLGDICHMKAGKFVKASDIISENNSNMYSCFGGNGLRGYVKSFTHEGEFLLIGRQGALCGNVKKVEGKFHATEHAIVCSPTMEYETLWLYHMLVMINLNKYATGAAQPGLNVGTLVELEAMFAPYALQNQFAERIQAIEAQKAQAQASLAQAEDLFNSLLQRAFNGELAA